MTHTAAAEAMQQPSTCNTCGFICKLTAFPRWADTLLVLVCNMCRCVSIVFFRLFFLGGSHSGFIGAHLAGQYPELYAAYSLRNPVTNIAAMAAATDIADCKFACAQSVRVRVRVRAV